MTDDIINSVTSTEEKEGSQQATGGVEDLVGDGKKYKDVTELAKGYSEADGFINQLKFENANMREEITKLAEERKNSTTLESVVKALESREQGNQSVHQTDDDSQVNVEDTVRAVLSRERSVAQATSNKDLVNKGLVDAFQGDTDTARAHVVSALERQGLSTEQFQDLVANSPKAAMSLLGLDGSTTGTQHVSISEAGNNTAPPTGRVVRNAAYYHRLKKEMGFTKFYADVKLQAQMLGDAEDLGSAYYNTE